MSEKEHNCDVMKKTDDFHIYEDDGWWLLEIVFERIRPIIIFFCPFCGEKLDD